MISALVPFRSHLPKVPCPNTTIPGVRISTYNFGGGNTGLQTTAPTHMREGHLLYSKSATLNINLIPKNTFTETSRITFEQMSGPHGPAKSEHKINHYKEYSTSRYFLKRSSEGPILAPPFFCKAGTLPPVPARALGAPCPCWDAQDKLCLSAVESMSLGGFPGPLGKIPLGFITCDLKPALRWAPG